MSGILVLAAHEGGVFKKTASELIGKASDLAGQLGTSVSAVVLGDADAASLGAFGATTVYQIAGDFSAYDNLQITAALHAAVQAADPDVFLAPADYVGKDAIPRLTARVGAGQGSDVTDLRVQDGAVIARRPMYGGKAFADVAISRRPAVFTVRPNSFAQPAAGTSAASVVPLTVAFEASALTVVERRKPETTAVDLTEAERIVSGGRSLKSKEQFDDVIRTLAATLGGTAGASRAAVDAGYAEHSDQVGQTGKTVNPVLYIACGISGAIQHLAGMRTSKVIVAINKDADAPIFEHATYGIVGDLFDVVPALQAELHATL